MDLLLDTHLVVWAMGSPQRLPTGLAERLEDPRNTPVFSVASLWELVIEARHALAVAQLPPGHRGPFDCLLLAQATDDGLLLVKADSQLAAYPGPVRFMAAAGHHT
jgi:PIN domain nuclease of toxin-antitoxin system